MSEEKETKKIKTLRAIEYKDGPSLASGVAVELETHIADRLIADGNAEEVKAEKPKDAKK